MVQNCGGGLAIAGTSPIRLVGAVLIASNIAGEGGGGAFCTIADTTLSAAAKSGTVNAFVVAPAPMSCPTASYDKEAPWSVAMASAFMVTTEAGARALVKFSRS